MKSRTGKVWPALALGFVMAMPGIALAPPAELAPAASRPVIEVVGKRLETSLGFGLQAGPGATHRFAEAAAGDGWSPRSAAEIRALPTVSAAKTSALVLSSLGMLGVIALHRLTRTF